MMARAAQQAAGPNCRAMACRWKIRPPRSSRRTTARRVGLAASMLDQATDTRFVRKAAAVTTSEGAPTLVQMIRREALKKK